MQDNYFDILSAADRLEEFLGKEKENNYGLNDYLICPICGAKLITENKKDIKYYCYKCKKDYYKNDLKEKEI